MSKRRSAAGKVPSEAKRTERVPVRPPAFARDLAARLWRGAVPCDARGVLDLAALLPDHTPLERAWLLALARVWGLVWPTPDGGWTVDAPAGEEPPRQPAWTGDLAADQRGRLAEALGAAIADTIAQGLYPPEPDAAFAADALVPPYLATDRDLVGQVVRVVQTRDVIVRTDRRAGWVTREARERQLARERATRDAFRQDVEAGFPVFRAHLEAWVAETTPRLQRAPQWTDVCRNVDELAARTFGVSAWGAGQTPPDFPAQWRRRVNALLRDCGVYQRRVPVVGVRATLAADATDEELQDLVARYESSMKRALERARGQSVARVSQAGLLARGWTRALVERFAGEPDAEVPNPHYRSAAPMKLYEVPRIEAIEATAAFQKARQKVAARSAAAEETAARKAAALAEEVAAREVSVRKLAPDDLLRRALDHYHDRRAARAHDGEWEDPVTPQADPAFLMRLQVNYARHVLTVYEAALDNLRGRVGVRQAATIVRRRVYDAIARAYPHLAEECARQLAVRTATEALRAAHGR